MAKLNCHAEAAGSYCVKSEDFDLSAPVGNSTVVYSLSTLNSLGLIIITVNPV